MKKNLFHFALFISGVFSAQTLTTTENYIYSRQYLAPVTTSSATAKQVQSVTYFDGLGRPKQIVNIKATTTGKDMVTPVEYDGFGRQVRDYLPVPQTGTTNGTIYGNPLSNVASTPYGAEKIYAEKILESSPLDRIQQQKQVGNDWNSKPVKYDYGTNTDTEVKKFVTTTTWVNNATSSAISLAPSTDAGAVNGKYKGASLYKNTVTDEDGNPVITYTNGEGQVLLIRKNDGINNIDTYYVYNEYDQLAFIISPLASAKAALIQTDLDGLCYQYRYNGKGKLVEKKLPGKGWEYMVYDNQDRLVMTQDANLGANKQWLFTKYDMFGRTVYTGIYTSSQTYGSAGRNAEQTTLNTKGSNNVARTSAVGFTYNGMGVYYDNDTTKNYPTIITQLLSVNYYDSYPTGSPTIPTSILSQTVMSQSGSISTKSFPTASYVKNIDDANWTKNYTWYDTKGRIIGTHSINYLGGYTKTETLLDFAGVPQQNYTRHKRLSTDTEIVVKEDFTYDPQNRLLTHKHQVDAKPQEVLAQNSYNELGQVVNKKVGGTAAVPLQTVDYTYNIRGWMTKINDPVTLGTDLFGYKISYNTTSNAALAPAKYNGNIAEADWKTANDGVLRRYGYQYDGLNRLKAGLYQEPLASLPLNNYFNETLTYDANGNIMTLVRNEKPVSGTTAVQIDNLAYNYTGNLLTKVSDVSANSYGYPGGGNTITYDGNGNMKNHLDRNIANITYNFLNLPNLVKFSGAKGSAESVLYTYRADGSKLKKIYNWYSPKSNTLVAKTTDYLDGFQYEVQSVLTSLQFVPTAEGYYDFANNRYVYNMLDHLGNIRLSYFKNTARVLEILEENNYYPFGLKHSGYNVLGRNPAYNYKYQSQELQETGFYSFKWRNYMPDVGRFFNIDPLSEKYAYQSHYNFSENRVVDGRELEGLEWENFRSSFNKPKDLPLKSPNVNTAQLQQYNLVVKNAQTSFGDFKKAFTSAPQDFLSNSKATFNQPMDGNGDKSTLKEGNYLKIDIAGPMNNSIVKVTDMNESKDNVNAKFQTVEGHIEKGIIRFDLTDGGNGVIGFTITSVSEPDMALAPKEYSRTQQQESWKEVLSNVSDYLKGQTVKFESKVVDPKEKK